MKKKNKMLFVGGIFPPNIENYIYKNSKTGIQFAANKLQQLILDGLIKHNIEVYIINNMFVGSYPKHFTKCFMNSFNFVYKDIYNGKNLFFINIFIIKHIIRIFTTFKEVFIKIKKENYKKIFIYSMHTPFLIGTVMNKIFYKDIEICLMIPDLPQYMDTSVEKEGILKKIDRKIGEILLKKIDKFILLTEQMSDILKIKEDKYIVIEGMCDFVENKKIEKIIDKKIVLYTGTLNKKYGVMDLVEAFTLINNSEIELWLCGKGDSEKEIINRASIDSRIKYLGQLENKEVVRLQKQVTLLVNPRPNNEEFTKYSFPSKIFEYYYSGTPVLMKKLDGIPDEYYNYCYLFKNDTIEQMSIDIKNILKKNYTEINFKGLQAQEYILKNKSNFIQVSKIINFFI